MPRPILITLCAGTLLSSAHAQCPHTAWTGEFQTPSLGLTYPTAAALKVFDSDGPGPTLPRLYVGGYYTSAGGIITPCIASWSGTQWASVGGGVSRAAGYPIVTGLGTHDADGGGPLLPLLIAAGRFDHAGGTPVQNVAAWDGASWSPLGLGLGQTVGTMTFVEFDPDGPGPLPISLFVAGSEGFSIPPSTTSYTSMARWDGAQWSEVPGAPYSIFDLAIFDDDGPGPAAPAIFAATDYSPGLYKWDGTTWSEVGGGLRSGNHVCDALLTVDEDGSGPAGPVLLAGGFFTLAGTTPVTYIARWDGQNWTNAGVGIPWQVEDLGAVDYTNGAGPPTLFATTLASGVYRRTPGQNTWASIGTSNGQAGLTILCSLASFDEDGPGPVSPSIYYTSPGMTLVNATPSYGIARYGCTSCYPNCDGSVLSPALNVNDFICFMNRFAAGDPYANCDNSTIPPVLNVNDFTCFNNRFAAGCS